MEGITMNRSHGFSLLECLMTAGLMAIMASLAWSTAWQQYHALALRTGGDLFMRDVLRARSEALHRGVVMTLCKSHDGLQCDRNGDWDQGWLMFVDRHHNAWVDDATNTILSVQIPLQGLQLRGNTPVRHYISWNPEGYSLLVTGGFQAGTLTLCSQHAPVTGMVFTLSASGRMRRGYQPCAE